MCAEAAEEAELPEDEPFELTFAFQEALEGEEGGAIESPSWPRVSSRTCINELLPPEVDWLPETWALELAPLLVDWLSRARYCVYKGSVLLIPEMLMACSFTVMF